MLVKHCTFWCHAHVNWWKTGGESDTCFSESGTVKGSFQNQSNVADPGVAPKAVSKQDMTALLVDVNESQSPTCTSMWMALETMAKDSITK